MNAKELEFSTYEEMLEALQGAGLSTTSELNLRSESNQKVQTVKRFPRLKSEAKKKSKLLMILEIAVPFNPATGKEDDVYNNDKKFRPIMSATSAALMLKKLCSLNEVAKAAFMKKAGMKEWNTEDLENLTDEDKKIFSRYRKPRIFTVPSINVKIPAISSFEGGATYIIDVKRDATTGDIIGEEPLALRVNRFLLDIAFNENKDYKDKIAKGIIKDTEPVQKEKVREIFKRVVISEERRSNFYHCFELPLDGKYLFPADFEFGSVTSSTVGELERISGQKEALTQAFDEYFSGAWDRFDRYFDFYEMDMSCPSEGDDMKIGKDTKFNTPLNDLYSEENYANFAKELREHLDNEPELEKIAMASIRMKKYNEDEERRIAMSVGSVIDTEDPFLTKEIILKHKDLLSECLGDEGDELIMIAEDSTEKGTPISEEDRKNSMNDYREMNDLQQAIEEEDEVIDDLETIE